LLGLGLILAPSPLMAARTGEPPDPLTAHVATQFGAAMLTIAIISWMAREAPESAARNAIVAGLSLLYVLLPIETIVSIARGSESAEGFVLVAVLGLLAAGFLLIGKPRLWPRRGNL
jgi:predicted permease